MKLHLLTAVTTVIAFAAPASAETVAIQAGRLITDASKPARGASTLVVDNGKIIRVEDGFTTPSGARIVDLKTKQRRLR